MFYYVAKIGFVFEKLIKIYGIVEPVSYTHLDVYKRQNHALASQFFEIGQGHGGIIIAGAQRLVGVVVRNDKEDIRFFIFLSSGLG